jgi:hypothetical protein
MNSIKNKDIDQEKFKIKKDPRMISKADISKSYIDFEKSIVEDNIQ